MSSFGGVETFEDEIKLNLHLLSQDEAGVPGAAAYAASDAADADAATVATVVASPIGSDDERRLSSRSRESKDLEWENEWELAQQVLVGDKQVVVFHCHAFSTFHH